VQRVEQRAKKRKAESTRTTHPFTVARQFAGVVVDDKPWRAVLEAGNKEGEHVSQALVAEKNVVVIYKTVLACNHHDPIGLIPFGLGRFLWRSNCFCKNKAQCLRTVTINNQC
jgi:hypothetical protein